jgi:hypothetical protein
MSALTQPLFPLSIETLCPYLISSIIVPRRTLPGSNFCPCDASAFHILDTGVHLSLKRLLRVVAFDHLALALAVFSKFCSFYFVARCVLLYCSTPILFEFTLQRNVQYMFGSGYENGRIRSKRPVRYFLLSFPANVGFSGAAECRQWTPAVFFSGVHSAP